MYYFCTYFDHRYLTRGLALFRSLKQHCPAFRLWVLCMDSICYDVLSQLGLSDIYLIALEDFERGDGELLRAKKNRTLIEYYFTCTPSLPLFILNNYPEVDLITYLDADLFFFADPAPIYEEMSDRAIAIIGHHFPPNLRHLEQYGIYNVGWLSFKRDAHAFVCLQWWREQCIRWCYDRIEEGRFADQKYLDKWPSLFQNVVVLRHKGANFAPWNLGNYKIHTDGNCLWVDDEPLIFFHFHGFKQIKDWLYDPGLTFYDVKPSKFVLRGIYGLYIKALLDVKCQFSTFLQNNSLDSLRYQILKSRLLPQYVPVLNRALKKLRTLLQISKSFFFGEYIVVIKGSIVYLRCGYLVRYFRHLFQRRYGETCD